MSDRWVIVGGDGSRGWDGRWDGGCEGIVIEEVKWDDW